jgi:thymidylate synthase (FAD)
MKITLIDYTKDPENAIGGAAAICYDSDTSREANIKRAKGCKDKGHLATLRFAYATFNISGISRVCSHQLVRAAHAGFLQRSQRYCKESDLFYVNPPALYIVPDEFKDEWYDIQTRASILYDRLVEEKYMHQQDARYILPQACETELNLCLNFQGYRDLFKNRCHKAAQWEVRDVANEMKRQLAEIAPNIFGD